MSDATSSATVPASTDTSTPPAATPAPARTRGYFNQSQLDEIDLAETVHRAALTPPYTADLATRDLDAAWLTTFGASLAEARTRSATTGLSQEDVETATAGAVSTGRRLLRQLQALQGAAKQKNRMLAEDGDPSTAFPVEGYLIGQRLDASRTELLQAAEALLAKAEADQLPGFKTDEALAAVRGALASYRMAEGGQDTAELVAGNERIARDRLVETITVRRQAVQYAADALYPYYESDSAPVRRLFALPAGRPMGG